MSLQSCSQSCMYCRPIFFLFRGLLFTSHWLNLQHWTGFYIAVYGNFQGLVLLHRSPGVIFSLIECLLLLLLLYNRLIVMHYDHVLISYQATISHRIQVDSKCKATSQDLSILDMDRWVGVIEGNVSWQNPNGGQQTRRLHVALSL